MSRPVDWWGRQVERQSRLQVERMSSDWWTRNYGRFRRIRRRLHWLQLSLWALIVASALVGTIIILSALLTAERILIHTEGVRVRTLAISRSIDAIRCRMLPDLCPELNGKKMGAREDG